MLRGRRILGESIGVVAQLGERLNGIQEVRSSILLSSTKHKKGRTPVLPFLMRLKFDEPVKNHHCHPEPVEG